MIHDADSYEAPEILDIGNAEDLVLGYDVKKLDEDGTHNWLPC